MFGDAFLLAGGRVAGSRGALESFRGSEKREHARKLGGVHWRVQKPESLVIRPFVPTAHPARGDAKPTDQ